MKTPEQLIADYLDDALGEADHADFNTWLKADPAHIRRFTEAVLFEQQIRAAVLGKEVIVTNEISRIAQVSKPIRADFKRPNWLARAAAWIGAFHLFSNTAKASTVIIMKKTVTSISAAIIIIGGSGVYAIHRNNESSRTRLETMETEIQSLGDQLGIKSTRSTNTRAGAANSPKTVSVVQVLAIYDGDNRISMQEKAILDQFDNQLAEMDVESLKNLLLDAEKISSPINDDVAQMIMEALISKSPADATQIACQLIGRNSDFLFDLSQSAANAFNAWLAKDPAAADAWYVATAAAGGLNSKSIPPNGLEDLAIDRSFARLRFAAQVMSNPKEAAAMLATMLPADVTAALQTVSDPEALRQILPKLTPAQKSPAAEGAIKALAAKDLDSAFSWANSLEMSEQERDSLLATGIEAAVANGKLDLAGVAERSKNLKLDAKRRSYMQVSSALETSLIPRKNPNVLDVENSAHWDRVASRIDWLRKEAPADSADEMVGAYLGRLAYASQNLERSLESYEQEVSRQGKIDPNLTIAFARYLGIMMDGEREYAAALKLLEKLPASEKRDHAIESIKMNN